MKDLVIIGAGPGGYEVALEAKKKGLSVTLIEKEKVGGTCLQCGCIPTKAYYKVASLLKEIKKSSQFGINSNYEFDFEIVKKRKDEIVNKLTEGILFSLSKEGVELIYGDAKIVDKNTVSVNDTLIECKNIIIATGSKSSVIPINGIDLPGVITSKEILTIDKIPSSLVIIGGGVIGIEIASIFNQFGCEVRVIEAMNSILPNLDGEVVKRLTTYLKQQGIKINTSTYVNEIISDNDLNVKTLCNGKEEMFSCENVLVSVGRSPNVDNLGLDEVGIKYSKKGIEVNSNYQTNVSNIYAVGDVTGKAMLAHAATYSGYAALDSILGIKNKTNFDLVPACVFTFPEVSMVGLTLEDAMNKYDNVSSTKALFRANGKAITMDETDGFYKIVYREDTILGIHIIGPHASDLIHEAVVIMNEKIPYSMLRKYIHAHPTLSEIVNNLI